MKRITERDFLYGNDITQVCRCCFYGCLYRCGIGQYFGLPGEDRRIGHGGQIGTIWKYQNTTITVQLLDDGCTCRSSSSKLSSSSLMGGYRIQFHLRHRMGGDIHIDRYE